MLILIKKKKVLIIKIITGSGLGLSTAAFSLALNTYFKKRRPKAAGIAMTITGIGPILYPPLITCLLPLYGVEGCVLILGAMGMHALVGACLLQPIKKHLILNCTEQEIESNEVSKPRGR